MWCLRINLLLCCVLAGCGFRPLNLSHPTTCSNLDVYVETIPDRKGQLLRQNLVEHLGQSSNLKMARYHLRVTCSEANRSILRTTDHTEGRNEVGLFAQFTLYDTEQQKIVLESQAAQYTSYSIGQQTAFSAYASIVSEKGVLHQLIPHLSQEIVAQIRSFEHRLEQSA